MNTKKIAIIIGSIVLVCAAILLVIFFGNKKYDIKFDSVGGSQISTQSVKKSEKLEKPANPTKEGYIFDNWYLDDEVFDFSKPITKNFTLVAKWIKVDDDDDEKFEVSFDTDGGNDISSIEVEKDKTITKPADPTKSGYKFISWQLNGKDFDFTTKITKDIELTAKWEKTSVVVKPTTPIKPTNPTTPTTPTIPTTPTTVSVTGVNMSVTTLALEVGQNSTISVTVNPSNATNKSVTWSSNNTGVATVDSNGKVVAVSTGTAVITVNASGKTATCTVTVSAKKVAVTGVSLNQTSKLLDVGATFNLVATVNPNDATNKAVTWTSSDASIASVNTTGVVTAKKAGTATITVKTADGNKTAICTVTISDKYTYTVTDYELNDTMVKVNVFKNNTDITSTVSRIFTSTNTNLGAYDASASAVLVNKSESSSISKALIAGKTYNIFKK